MSFVIAIEDSELPVDNDEQVWDSIKDALHKVP